MEKRGFTLIELLVVRKRVCSERSRRAFTLIELMVVIAIIAILATMILVSVSSAKGKARDATRKSDLRTYKSALAQYHSDLDKYPSGAGDHTWGALPGLDTTYIKKTPTDPQENHPAYQYATHDGIGSPLAEFGLEAVLEYASDSDHGDATAIIVGGNTFKIHFNTPTAADLNLTDTYNYAITAD